MSDVRDSRLERLREVSSPVSRETYGQLLQFEQGFRKWNASINLVAPSTLDDLWTRHILDSAQLLSIERDAINWLDIGSGGGFPGLVLAFLLKDRPGSRIELVESNRKKAAFLQATVGQFDLPARVLAKRIEDCVDLAKKPQIVTARALAALPLLLDLTSPWLGAGARALFHKGRDYRAEVSESTQRWTFDLIEHRSMIDPQSVILEVSNLNPANDR